MDLQEASTLAGIAVAVSGTIGALWYAGRQVGRLVIVGNRLLVIATQWDTVMERLSKVELHSTTMWEFVLRRGMAEAIQKGAATLNSPLRLRPEALEWMAGLSTELRKAYDERWKDLDDIGLCVAIEKEFGDRITMEVCLPHNITNAACLLIACAVAKGDTFVFVPTAT